MTFTQIKAEILARCNLTSTDADERVGGAINRHYKRITSLLGMETTRVVAVSVSTVIGSQRQTFSGIEKIDRILDTTDPAAVRLLPEVSLHNQRVLTPHDSAPQTWAMSSAGADSVEVLLDTVPQTAYSLTADGWTTRADLTGTDKPAFPASFHDILTWYVMSEELLRKEKGNLALTYETKANQLLDDLRFHLADTHTRDFVQNSKPRAGTGGGSGGGGGMTGGSIWTQTGLITFDRDPAAPFAVTPGSAKVDNLDADTLDGIDATGFVQTPAPGSGVVTNLNADKLDGIDSTGFVQTPTPGSAVIPDLNADKLDGYDESAFTLLAGRTAGQSLYGATVYGANAGLSLFGTPYGGSGEVPAQLHLYGAGTGAPNWVMAQIGDGGYFAVVTPAGAQLMSVNPAGIVELVCGRLAFPSTQVPSANAYTLDDYREVSWTPTITGSTGASGQSYSTQSGSAIKTGRDVQFKGRIDLSVLGTITGNIRIGGLPFAAANDGIFDVAVVPYFGGLNTSYASLGALIVPNTTEMELYAIPAGGAAVVSALTSANLTNTSVLIFGGKYVAAN